MFIAFEGLDGSGSSSQAKLLAERLERAGGKVLVTKEPTSDTPTGKLIRSVLQHQQKMNPKELQQLFTEDRAEHLKNVIEPALASGATVITDRYLFSTLAYGALEVEWDWLKGLNQNFRLPDITFLLKLQPAECLRRIAARGTKLEFFERGDKLARIWKNYERVAQEFPNIHVINSNRPMEEVGANIWMIIKEHKFISGELLHHKETGESYSFEETFK